MKPLEVGDEVIIRHTDARQKSERTATIVKVGRRWAETDVNYHRKFDKDTGYSNDDPSYFRALTAETWAEVDRRSDLERRFHQIRSLNSVPTDALEQAVRLLEGSK